MGLKKEIVEALGSGEEHPALLHLVRRALAQGMTPQAVYEALEQVWLDRAFDRKEGGGSPREKREFLMERVWFRGAP